MYIFLLGTAILLGGLAVYGLRRSGITTKSGSSPWTMILLIVVTVVGMVLGMIVGANSGFGKLLISWFNPGLPEEGFKTLFGGIGGGLLGAFFSALAAGLVHWLRSRKKPG